MDEIIGKLSRLKIANDTKKRTYPYYPSGKYLNHVYGAGKIPTSVQIKKNLLKDAIKENRKHMKRSSAAKKMQTELMPRNDIIGLKRFPLRYAIKLGGRIYDSRALAQWFKHNPSLPRPFDNVEIRNENRERVHRYNRRKLYRGGKRAYDVSSNEFHALPPAQKRRRIKEALEILDSY